MSPKQKASPKTSEESFNLKSRLEETEETLRAIRQYMVDAFVITRDNGTEVVTFSNADFPYRLMVESMNEGAITLIPDGTIFYCNSRFGQMVHLDGEKLIGVRFQDLIRPEDQKAFEELFTHARHDGARGEFCMKTSNGECIPVQLSIYALEGNTSGGISILATDISERIQAEERIRTLASQLAIAEQEERHRISQILHDDLQQRLFAIKTQLAFLVNDPEYDKDASAVREELKQIQRWLSDAIGITRSLSVDLSPIILRGEGLAEALMWLSAQMKDQHGLQVRLDAKDSLHELDSHLRMLLFQTIRELLFNVVKHAGTSDVKILLEKVDQRGRITISDSGKGFDVNAVMNDSKTAHGLLVIRDRLGLMGCTMDITSEPGRGTEVMIETPLTGNSVFSEMK